NLCEKTRAEGFDLMVQHAPELGGKRVGGARYAGTEGMQGVREVLAYGRAVVVERGTGEAKRGALLPASAVIRALVGPYWIRSAGAGKKESAPPTHSEPAVYRPLRIILLGFAFLLLFGRRDVFGILAKRFMAGSSLILLAGFALFLAGLGIS